MADEVTAMTTAQLLTALRAEKFQFSRRGQVMVVFGNQANTVHYENLSENFLAQYRVACSKS